MAWIKKNLVFVICSAFALLLLGVAIFLLLSNMSRNTAIQEELNQELANWQGLNTGSSFPNQENIDAAKKEQEKLRQFRKEASSVIPMATAPSKLSDQAFVNLLGTKISEMRTKAAQAGVTIPEQFDFTFSAQRKSLNFPAGSIQNWVPQLDDIESVCNVLFKSRVNALDSVQRVAVSPADTGTSEFLVGTIVSNQFAIFSPYQVSFRGFSSELATVLEELQRATNFIVVKSIQVAPATAEAGGGSASNPVYAPRGPTQADIIARRSGGGIAAPVGTQPRTRPGVTGPAAATVLSEQPLQVTLLLDVVKLNPAP